LVKESGKYSLLLRRAPYRRITWLRSQVNIPSYYAGLPTEGQEALLEITWQGLGIFTGQIYSNGQRIQNFTLDFGNSSRTITKSFPFAKAISPHDSYLIAIRLENKGRLPLLTQKKPEPGTYFRLQQAQLVYPQSTAATNKLKKCLLDLKLGLQFLDLVPQPPVPSLQSSQPSRRGRSPARQL